ncbi:unnamed protein product [Chrysoparadoxa australica]
MVGKKRRRAGAKARVSTAPSSSPHPLPDAPVVAKLRELVAPHVESFNYFLDEGLAEAVVDIPEQQVEIQNQKLRIWYESVIVGQPCKTNQDSMSSRLYPRECRERGINYSAPLLASVSWQEGTGDAQTVQFRFGDCPVMVRSNRCHLRDLKPAQLVELREEDVEMGGYFIVGGIERIVRLLQVPHRNHAQALNRPTFKSRGPAYSEKGVVMRCARRDQTTATVTLHYLTTGEANLRWSIKKQEFLVPVVIIIKALRDVSDKEIYERILLGNTADTCLAARIEVLLQDSTRWLLHSREACLAFLGSKFRDILGCCSTMSDEDGGKLLIDRHILVHVSRHSDKQECLLMMLRKLYMFVQGDCAEDNADALSSHELLLPGHLFNAYMKEKLDECLQRVKEHMLKDAQPDNRLPPEKQKAPPDLKNGKYVHKLIDRYGGGIGQRLAAFLSTGNVVSSTGLDLMQVTGFSVIAERLNFLRYLSHFRSVHRGQFFTTMKTTAVRKLLPESWGFLCPVHTPDGSPCGLLNHMAAKCQVVSYNPEDSQHNRPPLPELLVSLGMTPSGTGAGDGALSLPHRYFPICLDGRVLGGAPLKTLKEIVKSLRVLKTRANKEEDPMLAGMEVALLPPMTGSAGPYPGLFLFTQAARMIRPVMNLVTQSLETLGPMEQVYMEIACLPGDISEATTHRELDATNMLSVIASLTPFSDYNQSPRNMYQCQMGKQTMGTPAHSLTPHRTDNKMYRLMFPQAPIVQTERHGSYQIDNYPQGANAVVCVISYTGYDMEDAMILNKGSYDRGFGHASVIKTFMVDLRELDGKKSRTGQGKTTMRFGRSKDDAGNLQHEGLDHDGLPLVGSWVKEGDPLWCAIDEQTGGVKVGKHKGAEKACVESVRLLGSDGLNKDPLARVAVTLRFCRNPVIGDKFSSRHGQKGVMSVLWPQEDMPFTESGMTPDIIINPHAFPSRMTIGMLIESMAGKSGALHGHFQDGTPFNHHEADRVIDYFGDELRSAGYAYYGSEPLYSGLAGTVMHADIFIGVVYYQRLRHMVSDKSQVRATGPVNQLTRQPIKGRKNKGGVRFGEMERDSLLSHGAAFLLHDRLMNCSDRHIAYVCSKCGSILSPHAYKSSVTSAGQHESLVAASARKEGLITCRACKSGRAVKTVAMPYVFRSCLCLLFPLQHSHHITCSQVVD